MNLLDTILGNAWVAHFFNPYHEPGGSPTGGQFARAADNGAGMGGSPPATAKTGETTQDELDVKLTDVQKRIREIQHKQDALVKKHMGTRGRVKANWPSDAQDERDRLEEERSQLEREAMRLINAGAKPKQTESPFSEG